MFYRVPDVVVYPASQEQVETLVQLAKEMNTVIIPFGGGALRQDHESQSRQSAGLSFPVVQIGYPRKGVFVPPPPLVPGGTHSMGGEGPVEPIRTKGQTLWYSMYTIVPLRVTLTVKDQRSNQNQTTGRQAF